MKQSFLTFAFLNFLALASFAGPEASIIRAARSEMTAETQQAFTSPFRSAATRVADLEMQKLMSSVPAQSQFRKEIGSYPKNFLEYSGAVVVSADGRSGVIESLIHGVTDSARQTLVLPPVPWKAIGGAKVVPQFESTYPKINTAAWFNVTREGIVDGVPVSQTISTGTKMVNGVLYQKVVTSSMTKGDLKTYTFQEHAIRGLRSEGFSIGVSYKGRETSTFIPFPMADLEVIRRELIDDKLVIHTVNAKGEVQQTQFAVHTHLDNGIPIAEVSKERIAFKTLTPEEVKVAQLVANYSELKSAITIKAGSDSKGTRGLRIADDHRGSLHSPIQANQ